MDRILCRSQAEEVLSAGGTAVELCDAPGPRGGSWGADDTIVFTPAFPSGISRVPSTGGTPVAVTTLSSSLDRHNWPELLPDGSAVLFSETATGDWSDGNIVVLSLGTGERRVLISGASYARYVSPGYLVYARAGNLMAVRFDASRLEVSGDTVPVVEGMQQSMVDGGAQFSVSSSSALAYVPRGPSEDARSVLWVDTRGVARSIGTHPSQRYNTVRLSPDQERIVMDVGSGETANDVWVFDLARAILTRLTSNQRTRNPVWTPDGRYVTYWSGEGAGQLVWTAFDGTGSDERVYGNDQINTTPTAPGSWTPDGEVLTFTLGTASATGTDLWTFSLAQHSAAPLLQTQFSETQPAVSPDGHWIAYTSNASGRDEVYVQDFPDLARKWQISADGGSEPMWTPTGRQLFYRNGDSMMVADVDTQPSFRLRAARELFVGSFVRGTGSYDVAADGRFLMIRQNESAVVPAEARVVVGWAEELQRRLPTH